MKFCYLILQSGALSDHVLLGPKKNFAAPYTKKLKKKKKKVDAVNFQ